MTALLPDVDPDGLLEYSVVYTDRAVNHMSTQFQSVMRDIHSTLTSVYNAESAIVLPGSGTVGMEAVARQFAHGKRCLVIRNGWFSFRWSQIFDKGGIPASQTVLSAQQLEDATHSPFSPVAIAEAVQRIADEKPEVVFAPHVETSAGIMLPDDYLNALSEAVHAVGGMLVLDCVASGTAWVDMRASGVDVLVTAPQKGWSGTPCAGMVMLSERAVKTMATTESSSFSLDLKKWHSIMQAYLDGKHAYHATLPTDGLIVFSKVMDELAELGFDTARQRQFALGEGIRAVLKEAGFQSVAAPGFEAPGVVVCFTDSDELHTGKAFAAAGMQIAAGVPLQVGERADYKSFRIGLFGIDKLRDVDAAVARFKQALDSVLSAVPA